MRASRSERQMVLERDRALAAEEQARRLQIEGELKRDQLLAESDPDETEPVTVQQLIIAIDKIRNASVDGNSMQREELRNTLRNER